FDLSADRAEFVSRLFSRPRPATLNALSTPEQIFQAFAAVEKNEDLHSENVKAIAADLVEQHRFALTPDDVANVAEVYEAFYTFGPDIRYSSNQGGGFGGYN